MAYALRLRLSTPNASEQAQAVVLNAIVIPPDADRPVVVDSERAINAMFNLSSVISLIPTIDILTPASSYDDTVTVRAVSGLPDSQFVTAWPTDEPDTELGVRYFDATNGQT